MIRIDAEIAQRRKWGAVVVGTSFASMFFAHGLRSLSPILFVEKGGMMSHAEQLKLGSNGRPSESFRQINSSGAPKGWFAHVMFGGNSNCWSACTPRFHPDDFRLASRHGVGMDWPIGYAELEPYYCEVEELMDVAGGGSDHLLPRSRPFPSPPHAGSRSDIRMRAHSPNWFAQPTARSNGSRRPKCCANGVCDLCPIDSKFTILNSLSLLDRPDFHLLLNTEARQLRLEAGTARRLVVRAVDGREHELDAELFALGGNAISNPTILLRSGLSNPSIGRYLNEQLGRHISIDIDSDNYFGGTSITGHGYDFYAGDHRAARSAVLLENFNSPPEIRPEKGRWTHRVNIHMIAEDIPRAENQVSLENDEPLLKWAGFSPYAVDGIAHTAERLPASLPFKVEGIELGEWGTSEWHILGTTRMAPDAQRGVVDDKLVSFEARNLLCLGSGSFPTGSPANPTLTLSALSLRAGRLLS